eukprot:CAMPEP_0172486432 /NCGR_PEP_ID=MMETSP1066-20121228/15027_1 /TAXON_ID=671091 /ORGANISM="Coscinodiscus wailesii, Strain CCMP2513" /LENGTH=623 /DNA_ID=CAMNT_0013252401 /DNA_START=113 /DNA_END=1981 /DNA_ORIENTATION=+
MTPKNNKNEQRINYDCCSAAKSTTCTVPSTKSMFGGRNVTMFIAYVIILTMKAVPSDASLMGFENIIMDIVDDRQLPASVVSEFGQDREDKWMGTSPEYVLMNIDGDTVQKRRNHMAELDEVKEGACGGFEEHVRGGWLSEIFGTLSSSPWEPVNTDHNGFEYISDTTLYHYSSDTPTYRANGAIGLSDKVKRYFCRAPHPTRDGVTISIERSGPFVTTGGYSWTSQFGARNMANLTSFFFENPSGSIVGGMAVPVLANGTIIGHPPLHIHHAHVYPYGNVEERCNRIPGLCADGHHLVVQSHGETECAADQGGTACLLKMLDEGEAYRIGGASSGLSSDWEVNDVRAKGSEPLEWYFEVVIMHKSDVEPKAATYMGWNNPGSGAGPATYAMPYDSNANLMFYNYTHDDLASGVLKNWVLHTHMAFADSVFLFKGDNVHNVLDDFVHGLGNDIEVPIILDCHGHTLESAKKAIINPLMEQDGTTLVCEMTKTSLRFDCDKDSLSLSKNNQCTSYDKRSHLNCLKELAMEPGDALTVIAFNHVRKYNSPTRTESTHDNPNPYDANIFAAGQHSIFRADLISDENLPPALFYFARNLYFHGLKEEDKDEFFHRIEEDNTILGDAW